MGVPFQGFPSQPLYSVRTLRGLKAASSIWRAVPKVKDALRAAKPDVVFSTGGYSAAPVMFAARSVGIPVVVHEANSVPGRVNRLSAKWAKGFTCAFHETVAHVPTAIRTGQPIRTELRQAVASRAEGTPQVVVLGGSQGSAFLNELMPNTFALLKDGVSVVHAAGKGNYEAMKTSAPSSEDYHLVPYLDTPELVQAYLSSTVAVARSGGTLAEFAMFGLPSVLIPLPSSADDHQLVNARAFENMGGATVLEQRDATPEAARDALMSWIEDAGKRAMACEALRRWDVPDATERIVDILYKSAS
jgi:UDP-N-acetylglucosamine--N-acetylmuramyl-(pentapeptide) pyrophosphoryl-undecaprenol N-acetylglucosamine transferase